MNEHSADTISQDDRIMAAIAHATAILPMIGAVVPVIIWATQKERSAFIRFQALQAAAYQIAIVLAGFAGMACYMCSFFAMFGLTFGGAIISDSKGGELSPVFAVGMFLPFGVMLLYLLSQLAMIAYGLLAAALTLTGRDFRYIWLGRRIEEYLARQPGA